MPLNDKELAKKDVDEAAVLQAIDDMPEPDSSIGKELHNIITSNAPNLLPRTWYGMPAYSNGNKIVLFFRSTKKFGERYMTIGFNDAAKLDDGNLWPISFALKELNSAEKIKIADIIKKANS
jgi:uncharacterized protein YdhG (YjbR/CyaY superfamily)